MKNECLRSCLSLPLMLIGLLILHVPLLGQSPTIISTFPTDDALDVEVDINLQIVFDEPVFLRADAGTPQIDIFVLNGLAHEVFELPSPRVTGIGTNTITIDPINDLTDDTKYYVRIINAFEDADGNDVANITGTEEWSFDTGSPPMLTAQSPLDMATDVPIGSSLTLTYDEPIFLGTSPSPGITIRRASDQSLVETISFNNASLVSGFGTNTITITPSSFLPGETEFAMTLSGNSLMDASGDLVEPIIGTDWTFTTEIAETTPPTITNYSPANGATGISTTNWVYTLTFSEPVKAGTGVIFLKKSAVSPFIAATVNTPSVVFSGNEVTIDFNEDGDADGLMLEASTSYFLEIGSGVITDLAGNDFAGLGVSEYSFTTEGPTDTTPPSPVSFSPSNNAEEVAIDRWDYSITFNEPIQLTGTPGLSFQLRDASDALITEAFGAGATISGNTLSIDFNFDGELNNEMLDHSTFYHIEIDAGYIEDLAGNDYAGFTSNSIWEFETIEAPDNDPPTVVSLSPTNGASDVAIDANLIIEFNEDIYLDNDAGTFELRRKSPDVLVEAFDIFGTRISGGNNSTTITIDPTSDLVYETEYYFLIGGNDVIIDGGDNAFAGFSADSDWSFSTGVEPDNIRPTITNFSPSNGATDVENDDPIILTFSEDVQLTGFGPIRIRRAATNENLHEIDPASSQVSISGNIVTIQPTGGILSLEEEAEVYVNWSTTPFEDLAGNPFNGLFSSTDYRFTVNNVNPDMTGPSITALSPADDATDVAADLSQLTITFDEDVQKFHPGNIIIRNASGSILHQYFPVSSDTDITVSGNQVTIALNETLEFGTGYYVQLASNTFEDLAGNEGPVFLDATTWNFTTEAAPDNTAPSVTSFLPAHQSNDVAIDIGQLQVTFNEDVQKTNPGNIILRDFDNNIIAQYFPTFEDDDASVSGNVLTLNLPGNLAYETSFYVQFLSGTIADLAGNNFPGFNNASTWIFTTEDAPDSDPPAFVSLSPEDDALDVSTTANLEITFDENVFSTNHPINVIRIVDFDTDQSVEVFDPDENGNGRVTIAGNVITLNPTNDLLYDNQYYIIFNDDILQDVSGNVLPGYNNNFTWNFTTEADLSDVTPPSIVSVTPADNSTDVDPDTNLEIQFDEEVFLGNSSFLVRYYSNNVSQFTIPYSSYDVTVSGNTVTIELPGPLFGETQYWIQINANTITDAAGNGFSGILQANRDDWDFTTAGKMDQTISFDLIPDKTFGDALFTLNATASSGLPVTFDVINGPVSIDGNEVTMLGTGSASIRARQEGNGEYNAAVAVIRSFNIAKADQTISFDAIADKTFGDAPFELEANASSGLDVSINVVSGPASISENTVTINGAGMVTIAANQAGDDNYNAASEVQQTFEISKANQIITIEPIEDQLVSADPFEVSASINTSLELEYEISGPASLSGTTITLDGTAGTVTVTVSQAGNENYNEASESVTFTVIEKSDQSISFDEITDKTFGDAAFDLAATSSSGLAVEFSVVSGPISISDNTVTITGAGEAVIAANQSGNDSFNAALEVQQSFTIAKADQTITIDPIDDKVTTDAPFDVVASVDSGLELSYEVTGPATIDGTTITLDGSAGTVTVTVSQAGNDNYNSASTSTDFEVSEEIALSIEEGLKISFYPNPASDFINIESEQELEIRILNLNGQVVKNTAIRSGKIDVSDLASGSYILEMKTSDLIVNKRVIKAN